MSRPMLILKMALLLATALAVAACSRESPEMSRIEEVAFEQSGGGGVRYGYKVVFRKDGTASYTGDFSAARPGERRGEITAEQFERLVKLIKDTGFFSLEEPAQRCTDVEVRTITVVYAGGSKTITNTCRAVHTELERLEQEIILLVGHIVWRKAGG
jgi:hypothetical protein